MNAPRRTERPASVVEFNLNGKTVEAFDGETILNAAQRVGVAIPHLCYKAGYRADGNCRACVVEVKGERVLAPACCRAATSGMEVTSNSERAEKSQKMVLELLLSDMPETIYTRHSELDRWAAELNVGKPRFGGVDMKRPQPAADLTHHAIAVNQIGRAHV